MSVVPENAGRPESWLRLREAFLQEHQIGLRATGERPDDALPGWRRLQVSWRGLNHAVWVDDEYGDLSADAPLLSSEVLLRSLCDYADHASAAAWIKTNGRGIAPALATQIWSEGTALAGIILPPASRIVDQISDLDWQLNSGRAQILRAVGPADAPD